MWSLYPRPAGACALLPPLLRTVAPLSCAVKLPLPLPSITAKPAVPALENDEPKAFPEDS